MQIEFKASENLTLYFNNEQHARRFLEKQEELSLYYPHEHTHVQIKRLRQAIEEQTK